MIDAASVEAVVRGWIAAGRSECHFRLAAATAIPAGAAERYSALVVVIAGSGLVANTSLMGRGDPQR